MENVPSGKRNGKWLVIVNPNAGRRKGKKDWPEISTLLTEAGFDFHPVFTEHRDHAVYISEEHILNGYRQIIVVGGDGTLNEVVNGIFRQKKCASTDITLGMVMVGAGNDWGRMYNIPESYLEAVQVIKERNLFIQDAVRVTFHTGDEEKGRYLVNMAGIGYDAMVAQMTNRAKEKGGGGPLTYYINIFKGLFRYRHIKMEVTADDMLCYRGKVFSMNIGVCRYNGGGMMQLPNAVPDDGVLDVTIMKVLTKLDVVRNVNKLYDGSFVELPFVETYTGRKISILTNPPQAAMIEIDGESVGHSPLQFEILPKTIKIITGRAWEEKNEELKGNTK
jgi:YegS/Rv2252/BmrU family lipid kinase